MVEQPFNLCEQKTIADLTAHLIRHSLCSEGFYSVSPHCSAYQQGVDMNLGDYDGRTALHLAAAEGHARCVKFLLDTCGVKHDPKDRRVCRTTRRELAEVTNCQERLQLLFGSIHI